MGGAGFEPAKALASGFTAHPDCPLRHPPALEGTYSIDRLADDQHNPTANQAPEFIWPPRRQSECAAGSGYGALKLALWLLFRRLVLFGHLEISIIEAPRHVALLQRQRAGSPKTRPAPAAWVFDSRRAPAETKRLEPFHIPHRESIGPSWSHDPTNVLH